MGRGRGSETATIKQGAGMCLFAGLSLTLVEIVPYEGLQFGMFEISLVWIWCFAFCRRSTGRMHGDLEVPGSHSSAWIEARNGVLACPCFIHRDAPYFAPILASLPSTCSDRDGMNPSTTAGT